MGHPASTGPTSTKTSAPKACSAAKSA